MNQYNMQNFNDQGSGQQPNMPTVSPAGLVDVKDSISRHDDALTSDKPEIETRKPRSLSKALLKILSSASAILLQTVLFIVSLPKFALLLLNHSISSSESKPLKRRKKKKKKLVKVKTH